MFYSSFQFFSSILSLLPPGVPMSWIFIIAQTTIPTYLWAHAVARECCLSLCQSLIFQWWFFYFVAAFVCKNFSSSLLLLFFFLRSLYLRFVSICHHHHQHFDRLREETATNVNMTTATDTEPKMRTTQHPVKSQRQETKNFLKHNNA